MDTVAAVVDLCIALDLIGAQEVLALIQTCRAASVLKSDRIWKILLGRVYPGHPGKRAYRRFKIKTVHEQNQRIAERRKAHTTRTLCEKPWQVLNQRPICCYQCGNQTDIHRWTRDPTGRKFNQGFANSLSNEFPSHRPFCRHCLFQLWIRDCSPDWSQPRDPKPTILVMGRIISEQMTVALENKRKKAGRAPSSFLRESPSAQTSQLAFGAKRSAKIRWLYWRWRKNPTMENEVRFRKAKDIRNHHALAAMKRGDPDANLAMALAAVNRKVITAESEPKPIAAKARQNQGPRHAARNKKKKQARQSKRKKHHRH